jgi:hypothetical protein
MEWINVNDKMPPFLTKCIISNGIYVNIAWSKDEDIGWCAISPFSKDFFYEDVTHWMPLPPPPIN